MLRKEENNRKIRKSLSKRKKQVLFILLFLLFGIVMQCQQKSNRPVLIRGDPGSGESVQDWTFAVKDIVKKEKMTITVPEKKLTKKQAEKLLRKAQEEMKRTFLKKGQTLSHITEAVYMQESYADGLVSAEWSNEPIEDNAQNLQETEEIGLFIAEDGTLQDDAISNHGQKMIFCVQFTYSNYTLNDSFEGTLYKRHLTEKEQIVQNIKKEIAGQIQKNAQKKEIPLPKTVNQKEIEWKQGENVNYLFIFPLLGIAMAVMLEWKEKQDIIEKRKKRNAQLERDYPDFVSKMAVLLGAGMNMDAVFARLGETYRIQRKHGTTQCHEVYEQVLITTQEMQEGVGEVRAYERFGDRCGIAEYRRLCSYISQNLRKGTSALATMLEKESEEALHKRRQMVQKVAEEAGSKLLFPMLLMLLDIMIILMVGVFMKM